jgi:hypothetical protein
MTSKLELLVTALFLLFNTCFSGAKPNPGISKETWRGYCAPPLQVNNAVL